MICIRFCVLHVFLPTNIFNIIKHVVVYIGLLLKGPVSYNSYLFCDISVISLLCVHIYCKSLKYSGNSKIAIIALCPYEL